jgi:DNA-binding response OmpR family regulator
VTDSRPTVLVVDDETAVTRAYSRMLADRYEVRVANDGATALDLLDETVEAVLLDRMMPGLSGDEVLAELRDRGFDCGVAMVTAVEPELDIVEMGFDTYLQKPPSRERLVETVEGLLARRAYTDELRGYTADLEKLAVLPDREDADAETARERLTESLSERRGRLDAAGVDLGDDLGFLSVLSQIERRADGADADGGSSA